MPSPTSLSPIHAFSLSERWKLTARQAAVAGLLAEGLSTNEIAQQLGISAHTARHHTEQVFVKLGVRRRARVAALLVTAADEARVSS